jgi:hypothetical protein
MQMVASRGGHYRLPKSKANVVRISFEDKAGLGGGTLDDIQFMAGIVVTVNLYMWNAGTLQENR